LSELGVGNLRPMCQMWPTWKFDMAHIRIFTTQVRAQHCIRTKLYGKQVLRSMVLNLFRWREPNPEITTSLESGTKEISTEVG